MFLKFETDDAPGTTLKLIESKPEDPDSNEHETPDTKHSEDSDPSLTIGATQEEENVPEKTPEELIERARLQANLLQKQLQKDLDALAAAAADKSEGATA